MHRDTGRILGDATQVRTGRLTVSGSIWGGIFFCCRIIIYKCNNFPEKYLPPPPKIYLTLFALPFIMRVKESNMAKIYERNPDTDEVRERERVEPKPYRNEMAEAVEILQRIEEKLDAAIERMK